MGNDPRFQQCMEMFLHCKFAQAADLSLAMLEQGAAAEVALLLLLSMQYSGTPDALDQLTKQLLSAYVNEPWWSKLVQLVAHQAEGPAVIAAAVNDVQRSQANYYCGARLLAGGNLSDALTYFESATSQPPAKGGWFKKNANAPEFACVEQYLAKNAHAILTTNGTEIDAYFTTLLARIGNLSGTGLGEPAGRLGEQLRKSINDRFGTKHAYYAKCLNQLGGAYQKVGKFDKAIAVWEEALQIKASTTGVTNESYMIGATNLAAMYGEVGRVDDAERLALQMLRGIQSTPTGSQAAYLHALRNLAGFFLHVGRNATAQTFLQHIVAIQKTATGTDRLQHADSLWQLSEVYHAAGSLEQAISTAQESIDVRTKVNGDSDPQLGIFMLQLTEILIDHNRLEDAKQCNAKATRILFTAFRETNVEVPRAFAQTATIDFKLQNYPRAEHWYRRALEVYQNLHGRNYVECGTCLNNLALVFRARGELVEAKRLTEEAIEVFTAISPAGATEQENAKQTLAGISAEIDRGGKSQVAVLPLAMAFGQRDYDRVYEQAYSLYCEQPSDQLMQLMLISLQRTGKRRKEASVGQLALEHAESDWNRMLLELTLGKRELPSALAQATDDEQRCQAFYYAGARNLSLCETQTAYAAFDTCATFTVTCRERSLAAVDRESPPLEPSKLISGLQDELMELTILKGHFDIARKIGEEAYEFCRRHPSIGDNARRNTMDSLARVYEQLGQFEKAETLFLEALAGARLTAAQQPLFQVAVRHGLSNLAGLYTAAGRLDKAAAYYRESMEIARQRGDSESPDFVRAERELGELYMNIGDYRAAQPLLEHAVTVLRAVAQKNAPTKTTISLYDIQISNAATVLADCYRYFGHFAEAESLYQEALEYLKRYHQLQGLEATEQHPNHTALMLRIADLRISVGDFPGAESLLQRLISVEARHETLRPVYAQVLLQLARVQVARGEFLAAEPLYTQAENIFAQTQGKNSGGYHSALSGRVHVYAATGRADLSLEFSGLTNSLVDESIRQTFAIGTDRQRMAKLQESQNQLYRFLSLVTQLLPASPEAVRQAANLVLRRKGLAAEALAAQRDAILAGRSPELKTKLAELTALRMQVARLMMSESAPDVSEKQRESLTDLQSRRERLEVELAERIPEMQLQSRIQSVDLRSISKMLPKNCVLIEFAHYYVFDYRAVVASGEPSWKPPRYLAFVIKGDSPDELAMIDLGDANTIDQQLAAFRAEITGESEACNSRDLGAAPHEAQPAVQANAGATLVEMLWNPLSKHSQGAPHLLLAPDGVLNKLPFEVLPVAGDTRLIDLCCVSYLGCGRDILRFNAAPTGPSAEPIVVADPDFDYSTDATGVPTSSVIAEGRQSRDLVASSVQFSRLPGTRDEARAIAQLLKVRPWLGADVLETRLKQVRSPWVLHVATHGFFLPDQAGSSSATGNRAAASGENRFTELRLENPLLRSGLALAGGNTWLRKQSLPPEAEDGLLTAEDVAGMDLANTDLVVLSACNTGMGEIRSGEGVFGLRRSFVVAGCKTLVMSLWKVPDRETQELMSDFYARVLKGQPRAAALRDAQRALRAKHPHPLFWGAFICQGDPRALPARRRWYYKLDGKLELGPVSTSHLKELIRTGQLRPTSMISADGLDWQAASKLQGVEWK